MTEKKNSLDEIFYKIMTDLVEDAMQNASESAIRILDITEQYLSKDTFACLKDFYSLYFDRSTQASKEKINQNVDDLFDQAQKMLEEGQDESLATITLNESESDEKERLALTALQKKLETLITLEEGVKEKLAPVLGSMQFEDSTRKRLQHITFGMELIFKAFTDQSVDQFDEIAQKIADELTSIDESELYYNMVMNEPPPAGFKDKGILIEF